jgi:AraC-like DNA-binding protein
MPNARLAKPFTTLSMDRAAEAIEALYGTQARIDYHGAKEDFGFDMSSGTFGDVRLMRWSISSMSHTRPADESEVHINFPIEGELSGQSGSHRIESSRLGKGFSLRPDEGFACSVAFARGITLRAPTDALLQRAELLTGKHYGRSLLEGMNRDIDLGSSVAAILAKTMKTAMVETANLDAASMGGVAAAGYEDLLLNLAVAVLFSRVAKDLGHAPPDCGAAVISRVREHIHAHASEVIEMAVVAKQFDISMRAMQENFKRYYGFSPRDYLIECRLDRAHQSLLLADGARSIFDVAMDCGFTDHKHFSAKYRDKYGESPSETHRAAIR